MSVSNKPNFYLVIAGISLLVDAVDVIRYLLGDGELYLRWAMLQV